jgi:uncharacterized membrane protein (UPF0127 family)
MTAMIITAAMLVPNTWVPKDFVSGRAQFVLTEDVDCKKKIASSEMSLRIADSDSERARGLSGREIKLSPNEGMIFLPSPGDLGGAFWMKETHLPLSIAFFDGRGKWTHFEEMPVEKDPLNPKKFYAPKDPYLFAVEMPKGWFKTRASSAKNAYLCVVK